MRLVTAERTLHRWMPPGVVREPLMLFKVLERHPELASRMRALGSGLIEPEAWGLALPLA